MATKDLTFVVPDDGTIFNIHIYKGVPAPAPKAEDEDDDFEDDEEEDEPEEDEVEALARPKSLQALFGDDYADRWTQDAEARNEEDEETEPNSPDARYFSLVGGAKFVYPTEDEHNKAMLKLALILERYTLGETKNLQEWNDSFDTDFEDIRRLVAIAGV